MLELNQFRQSAFCLKVRMVLAAKKLNYRVIEITPGIGQVAIFRLSGQRQLPVLVDGENVITDSSSIIRYLEQIKPEPKLLPNDPRDAAMMHILEDWADTTFANSAKTTLIKSAATDPDLRDALLPDDLPLQFRKLINGVHFGLITDFSELLSKGDSSNLFSSLKKLTDCLQLNRWLVGDTMTFADIAIAAQLSLLRFPESAGSKLAGKGCPGFSDHPSLTPLFDWRDQLETDLLASDPG